MAIGAGDEDLADVGVSLAEMVKLAPRGLRRPVSLRLSGFGESDGSRVQVAAFARPVTAPKHGRKAGVLLSYDPAAGAQSSTWSIADGKGNHAHGVLIALRDSPTSGAGGGTIFRALLFGAEGCGIYGGAGGAGELNLELPAAASEPLTGTLEFRR